MSGTGFVVLLSLFVIVGAVLGWVAFFRSNQSKARIDDLQQQVQALKIQLLHVKLGTGPQVPSHPTPLPAFDPAASSTLATPDPVEEQQPTIAPAATPVPVPALHHVDQTPLWLEHLRSNWMVWLGGVCVALSGIFLVRYSIEQGLLGPTARIACGLLTGIALHVAAEWLRRRHEPHIVFAALAGGGSITLFAALLSALHLYQLLSPTLVFVLLALVSLLSMTLALLHGPVLAILGILGAYLVPLLVGGDGGSGDIVLAYTLIISAATLLLMSQVQRSWLWTAALVGGLLWWLLTLGAGEVDAWRGLYLAALAWLFLALPEQDWLLRKRVSTETALLPHNLFSYKQQPDNLLPATLTCLCVALALSLASDGFTNSIIATTWLVLPGLLLLVAGRRTYLGLHVWGLLVLQIGALLLSQWQPGGLQPLFAPLQGSFTIFCIALALTYSGFALYNLRSGNLDSGQHRALWVSIAVMAPLGCLTLSYLLTAADLLSLQWSLVAAAFGAFYLALAAYFLPRQHHNLDLAWLFIGGHLGYTLAAAMYFREAGLTLALALQIVSLGCVIRRFQLQQLDLVLKLVVMTVIARLSLNPWVLAYADRVPWPLLTYAGATLCCMAGSYLLQQRPKLQAWTIGASMHLLALTIWVALRYALYDGAVFSNRYGLTEAALNQNIFAVLGLIYYWRARFSEHLKALCQLYAFVLLGLSLLNYTAIVLGTLGSHPWVWQGVGPGPVFNLLLLTHGTPTLLFYCCARFYLPSTRTAALLLAVASAFIFVSLEIMHLWRGNIRVNGNMADAELYTYSAVWLVLACAALLGGAWRFGQHCYRGGLLLLLVVIAKLFLVDMAGLTGLLRVASFMGMGLALLAIAYLYQKLKNRGAA